MFYTYVLQSEGDGKFYAGSTVNLKVSLAPAEREASSNPLEGGI